MSKHFTSVLELTDSRSPAATKDGGAEEPRARVTVSDGGRSVVFADNSTNQPRPLPDRPFAFDNVFTPRDEDDLLYKRSVKEVVEATLVGYHGTVISLRVGSGRRDTGTRGMRDATCKATGQIFRALKKSRRSQLSSTSLVVLCSFAMLLEEGVYDLLSGFVEPPEEGGAGEAVTQTADSPRSPLLSVVNGEIVGGSTHEVNTTARVSSLLRYGSMMEEHILRSRVAERESSDSPFQSHQTIFRVTVEYSQFGSMKAPISGNLLFVDIGTATPLANRQRYITGDTMDKSVISLFTFADTIKSLTPRTTGSVAALELYDEDDEVLPCVPITQSSELYSKSLLTQLLKEALGGNCKTLLICHMPEMVPVKSLAVSRELIKLASRARLIQNTPNKRDLAERALMSAYMKELKMRYGEGLMSPSPKPEPLRPPVFSFNQNDSGTETPVSDYLPPHQRKPSQQESVESEDLNSVYGEMIELTEGEERKRNVEMAASALAAAAIVAEESEDEEEEEKEEEEGGKVKDAKSSKKRLKTQQSFTLKKKQRQQQATTAAVSALDSPQQLASSSSSSLDDKDVTIDALVSVLQDPDRGVPRALTAVLKDVRIRRDVGALFSGADIVRWMVENVDGVDSESDAEKLGQLLLDKGAIFHSEGSMVFAGADTLFYYAREGRQTLKLLSLEDIQALLARAREPPINTTSVENGSTSAGEEGMAGNSSQREGVDSADGGLPQERTHNGGESDATSKPPGTTSSAHGHVKVSPHRSREPQQHHEGSQDMVDSAADSSTSPQPDTGRLSMEGDRGGGGGWEGVLTSGVETVFSEDWMRQDDSSDEEKEKELKGVTGKPDTAPLDRMPSIHTLENSVDYPHPLHMAVAVGKQSGVVRNLVMMFGVDKCDEQGRTPLMFAALGNKRSSCTTLIECGAHVNHQDSSGLTALQVASYHGSKEAASVLLSKKASVYIMDNMGHSVLHWSTVPPAHGCLELLIRYASADLIGQLDCSGLTALHWAIYYDRPHHINVLVRRYDNALLLDSEGRTLMSYAIHRRAFQCINVLLTVCPVLLTLPDDRGCTPLHHAAAMLSPDYLHLLLSHKLPKNATPLDINCTDQQLRTPLHCATACNRPENVKALLGAGASLVFKDQDGQTPMDYAQTLEGESEIVSILQDATAQSSDTENKPQSPSKSKFCSVL